MFVPIHNETREGMLGRTPVTVVSHNNIAEAHRRALACAETTGRAIAPSYALLPYLPFMPGRVIPNTEEIYGIDTQGIYAKPGTPVVITYHGGQGSILSPATKLKAFALHEHTQDTQNAERRLITVAEDDNVLEARIRDNFEVGFINWLDNGSAEVSTRGSRFEPTPWEPSPPYGSACCDRPLQGLTNIGTVVLEDVYPGRDIVTEMLNGRMPDGSPLLVFPYGWYLHEGAPSGYKPHAVVRPLELVRESFSGLQEPGNFLDDTGRVKDSQLVTLAGGGQGARQFLRTMFNQGWGKSDKDWENRIGLSHPYNHPAFDESLPQARWMSIDSTPATALGGGDALYTFGRYMVVPK